MPCLLLRQKQHHCRLSYWGRQRMHWWEPFSFWIKLYGPGKPAFKRTRNVWTLSREFHSFAGWWALVVQLLLSVQVSEITRLENATKKLDRELKRAKGTGSNKDTKLKEQRKENLKKKSRARLLNLIKSALDILVADGLLQLAPRTITPRVTGGLGFITSVISCYQLLPPPAAAKAKDV